MAKIEGGCRCGGIRYSCDAEPAFQGECYCKECQVATGSSSTVIMAVPSQTLTVTGNTLKTYDDKGGSGKLLRRYFCEVCGTPLYTQSDGLPGMSIIKIGTLDDTSWVQPQMRIWWSEAPAWVKRNDEIPTFDENPPA